MYKFAFIFCILAVEAFAKKFPHQALYDRESRNADISIEVTSLSTGKVLYSQKPHALLIPASVTKLFTAAASLDHFTPVHSFKTRIYYDGSLKDGRITGNLYVLGGRSLLRL